MNKFAELLSQLNAENEQQEALAKALPQDSQDDEKIQAAAEDGEGEEDEEGDGEESMTKSLKLEDGEEVIDATDMLKSLEAQIGEHDDVLAKALPQMLTLMQGQSKMIQQQGDLIKSLQTKVDALAGQGRGRKAVVALNDKPAAGETMAKSEPDGLTPGEFMLKANNAFDKKIISGVELSTIDVCLRTGQAIDKSLIAKVANS